MSKLGGPHGLEGLQLLQPPFPCFYNPMWRMSKYMQRCAVHERTCQHRLTVKAPVPAMMYPSILSAKTVRICLLPFGETISTDLDKRDMIPRKLFTLEPETGFFLQQHAVNGSRSLSCATNLQKTTTNAIRWLCVGGNAASFTLICWSKTKLLAEAGGKVLGKTLGQNYCHILLQTMKANGGVQIGPKGPSYIYIYIDVYMDIFNMDIWI